MWEAPVLVITPADHTVTNPGAFTAALQRAVQEAAQGAVVILGITPDRPETGYGYIQAGGSLADQSVARPVQRFVEKPDAATAAAYLAEGGYFWHGGIFVLLPSTWLSARERFLPAILGATRTAFSTPTTQPLSFRPHPGLVQDVPGAAGD